MTNYAKLNLSLDTNCLEGIPLQVHRTLGKRQKYAKDMEDTHSLLPVDVLLIPSNRVTEYLISQLPVAVRAVEIPTLSILEMNVPKDCENPMFGTHVDLARVATINYYMEANGEETCFYQWENEKAIPVEKFVAQKDEAYLLDVSVPHSVKLIPGKTRRILTMSFVRTSYNDLRRMCASKVCK